MKQLTFRIVIPLAVISLAIFTKWWYAFPADAPDTMFTGFPFPFVGEGWHTSLSLQIFITEFIADLLIYFSFWLIVFYCINRFIARIAVHKIAAIVLWVFSGLIITGAVLIAGNKDNIFYVKRPFEMEVKKTGFKFGWQHKERPDL